MEELQNGNIVLGICAMDVKARSKSMSELIKNLITSGQIDIIIFGEDTILNEPVENWPLCNCLIAFYSDGFPLDKAIQYVELRYAFGRSHILQYALRFVAYTISPAKEEATLHFLSLSCSLMPLPGNLFVSMMFMLKKLFWTGGKYYEFWTRRKFQILDISRCIAIVYLTRAGGRGSTGSKLMDS